MKEDLFGMINIPSCIKNKKESPEHIKLRLARKNKRKIANKTKKQNRK